MKNVVYRTPYIVGILFVCIFFLLNGCTNRVSSEDANQIERMQREQRDVLATQFIASRVQDDILTEVELQRLITASEDAHILDDELAPQNLQGISYEEKLQKITDFTQKMMQETGRTRISEHDSILTSTEIPLVDIITGIKKYFFGEDGTSRYADYLAQRFDIGVYPTMEELQGDWIGEMTITHIAVFNELGSAPIGYDIQKIMSYQGNKNAFDFTVNSTSENTGTIVPYAGAQTIPFVYTMIPDFSPTITSISFTYNDIQDKGHGQGSFDTGVVTGTIQIDVTKESILPMKGHVSVNLFDGYIVMSGDFVAQKK